MGGIANVDVLRLTLLAPDIVEMILDGRQSPGLQFEQLRKSLPLEWQAQHYPNALRPAIEGRSDEPFTPQQRHADRWLEPAA
jgi:hypothetical protein